VVVIDSRKARDSRALEEIGYYNPLENPHVVNIDRERVAHWTGRGAQVSDGVKGLLRVENRVHPTRRTVEAFEPEAPPEKPKPKAKAAKAPKAEEGGVAVATDTEGAPAPAKKTTKKTAAKKAPKAEAAPEADAAPKAEAVPEAETAAGPAAETEPAADGDGAGGKD
jgi:small subunit ribosomal protein S16